MSLHLFVESLTTLDSSYASLEHGLSGITYIVDLEITGETNSEGMLLDFGVVKKTIKQQLEDWADHLLLIPEDLPGLVRQPLDDKRRYTHWFDQQQNLWAHQGPEISTRFIPGDKICPTRLGQYLENKLINHWQSKHVQAISLQLRQEPGVAMFEYSHGLRLHKGACQRIAHGHRSKVQAFDQEGFNQQISNELAAWLDHKYLVDQHNVSQKAFPILGLDQPIDDQVFVAYQAPEGYYQLSAPNQQCIWMNSEVTIENIAKFLLQHCHQLGYEQIESIRVYEGLKKGAIAKKSMHP